MAVATVATANLAALARSTNILAGSVVEFVPELSRVLIYSVPSASTATISVLADNDIAIDNQAFLRTSTTIDKSIDLMADFIVLPGTRLSIFFQETGNVATTDFLTSVEVTPIGA